MKISYRIEGMHCVSCTEKVKSALSPYVKIIQVTFNPPLVQIEAQTQPSLDILNTALAKTGDYRLKPLTETHTHEEEPTGLRAYYPIFLIAAYIVGVALINNFHAEGMNWQGWMNQFMAGFFLVFSAFKFLDLKGFAEGYATYDLLARRWHTYGFIYPFLELGLGILYLGNWWPVTTALLTIIIMGFSSLGVINSLLKKQKLRCACLGTILKVPLSSITLIEDLTMVVLAVLMLVLQ